MYCPGQNNVNAYIDLCTAGHTAYARVSFRGDGNIYVLSNGVYVKLQSYSVGTWYTVRIVMQSTGLFDVYVNSVAYTNAGSHFTVESDSGSTFVVSNMATFDALYFFATAASSTAMVDNIMTSTMALSDGLYYLRVIATGPVHNGVSQAGADTILVQIDNTPPSFTGFSSTYHDAHVSPSHRVPDLTSTGRAVHRERAGCELPRHVVRAGGSRHERPALPIHARRRNHDRDNAGFKLSI